MKKEWKAILLAGVLAMTGIVAQAAQWAEGTGPERPYSGVPEVDLDTQVGYQVTIPSKKMTVDSFCDTLQIYLPRPDMTVGEGKLSVISEDGETIVTSFSDADLVKVRPMDEDELGMLMWGSGVCFDIGLPKSLTIGKPYYVNMEEGCFVSEKGLKNPPLSSQTGWTITVGGDYGVNALAYTAAPAEDAAEDAEPVFVNKPEIGGGVTFEIALGGDAASAVIRTDDDCLTFDEYEFTESCTVTGTVNSEATSWGVIFLDAEGNYLEQVDIAR